MAVWGLDVSSKTKDFSYAADGSANMINGKERSERNFKKMILTAKGPLEQVNSNDDRYNPLFGTRLEEFIGAPLKGIAASVDGSRSDLRSSIDRFIANQEKVIDFMEEDEYISKGDVSVIPYKGVGIYFVIDLFTAKDRRLGRNPSFQSSFFAD